MTDDVPSDAQPTRGHGVGDLLEGYLLGSLTPSDAKEFARWLAATPDGVAIVRALRATVAETRDAAEPRIDVQAWWQEFGPSLRGVGDRARQQGERLDARSATGRRSLRGRVGSRSRGPRGGRLIWGAAAGIAAALLVGVWQRSSLAGAGRGPAADHRYVTARGERAIVTLDGARVVLGPASEMRVPADFAVGDRVVSLVGHAYFEVKHDSAHPFRVRTAQATTQDIGTRFDVRAYADEAVTRVVVSEGAVSLRAAAAHDAHPRALRGKSVVADASRNASAGLAPTLLSAGELGAADGTGVVRVTAGVAVDRYTAWHEGRLEFVDTPLAEALADIERWYDVELRLGDPALGTRSLTASFADDAVDDVMHTLARALGVRLERRGRRITLYPAAPPNPP